MKKRFTFISLALMFMSAYLAAQSVPNGGFENWSSTNFFEEPTPFATSNSLTYLTGGNLNVTKTTDSHSGTYAAHMETIVNMEDTIPALMMIGHLEGALIGGGMPFTSRPDSLTGYIKYDMAGDDEVFILCLFKSNGLPLGVVQASFTGSQASYTRFSVPVVWYIPLVTPDSVNIVIATTSSITTGTPGSTLYADDFNFVGGSDPFPNGDFETWDTLNDEEPDSWTTINYITLTTGAPYATQTSDSHSGDWALRIENVESFVQQVVGFATNGYFQGFNWGGGLAVDQNPSAIHGYYKYMPQGDDSAQVLVNSYRMDPGPDTMQVLESVLMNLPPASVYTPFDIPLSYDSVPKVDTVNISFSAGYYFADTALAQAGSVLYLDDISIDYYPLSVAQINPQDNQLLLYPNPSNGILNLQSARALENGLDLRIFDMQGREVKSFRQGGAAAGKVYSFNLETLQDGFYTYTLISGKNIRKGKFCIMR